MRKFLVGSFYAILILLVATQIMVVNAPETRNRTESAVSLLQQLCGDVSALPNEAFEDARRADVKKNTLCNKINAVIHQVEADAYRGALNKLRKDVKGSVTKWVGRPWRKNILSLIRCIVKLIKGVFHGPKIHWVFRCPVTPEYDDYVLVLAYVTDCRCGVANVTLSYSVNFGENVNLTMNRSGRLYRAEIPPQPYNATVTYLVYAYGKYGNVAVSEEYSYVVGDYHSPTISYVERVPAYPNYNETVLVFVNATEPSFASGVKEVILAYNNGTVWMNVTMSFQEELYVAAIPELPYGTVVQYTVYAFDNAGNWAVMDIYSYTVEDRFLPIARIDAPACGGYLAGYVDVEVYVYDDNFLEAELKANETVLASWSEVGSHTYVWNTTALPDGVHLLSLHAHDEAGNIGEKECIVKVDNTAPTIGVPSQSPGYASVQPYENVTVTVEVRDEGIGVREVILSYSVDEKQTWINITTDRLLEDSYRAVIPGFEADTHVQYEIIAYDKLNNLAVENNAGEYYVYTVIPEFQEALILIFMIATSVATVLIKKRKK